MGYTASKNKLFTKIIFLVEVIILITSTLFCTVSIYRARVGIRMAIQQRMLDISNCAAGSVNGDILKTLDETTIGSPEYNDLYSRLAVFRDNVELEYVYAIKQVGEKDFIFTMDLDQVRPAAYGDSVKYTEALASAGRGLAAVDEVPYSDSWGEFYSAYSPVFDSEGNVAGIVAADFAVDWFENQLTEQTRSTMISYAVILLFSLLVAAGLSLITVRPFVRAQGELLAEKVRAESANHAKSDFLANMSHEIRTPINAVLGMNEMILREDHRAQELAKDDSEAMLETLKNINVYANDVKNAGHNLLAIVNDILDFSKIEAGKMDITEAPYQLSSLLNDLNNMILFKAQDKKLDFKIDVDRTLPDDLYGDEVRVRQVLTNILGNAVKYTEKGSVRLTLRGEEQGDGTILLKAEISDTGIGIRPEDKEKLFTKFQRLEMERNSTVEGTGLGLVITQRLLDMMGGTIAVESEYGKGSVFTVTIPQRIVSNVSVGNFQERFETNMQKGGVYKESFRAPSAKVLVVDDTRINLAVVQNLLKSTLMQIDTALSGAEAVKKAEENAYDLILMDQRMPEMDGTEALHKIRETSGGKSTKTPVICLTADAVIGAKERYLSEGFSDYLTKPIDSYALEKMLKRHLPLSKMVMIKEDPEPEPDPVPEEKTDDGLNALRAAGVDPSEGLQYTNNDEEFYRTLLNEYAVSYQEKSEKIKETFFKEDWKEYGVYVHALKSTSKMIGAMELSELAAKLEAAANNSDIDTIKGKQDLMMKRYEAVAKAINLTASK